MPGERVLWSNSEIAIVVFEGGSVGVYFVEETTKRNYFNNNPANFRDIIDAERANELGIKVKIPEAVYKQGPLFTVEEILALAKKIAQERVSCFDSRKKWQYSSGSFGSLPEGIDFKLYETKDGFTVSANTDIKTNFLICYTLLSARYCGWDEVKPKQQLQEVPREIIAEAEELQRAYSEEQKRANQEYRRKKDEEDRVRLMAKYGIKQ